MNGFLLLLFVGLWAFVVVVVVYFCSNFVTMSRAFYLKFFFYFFILTARGEGISKKGGEKKDHK